MSEPNYVVVSVKDIRERDMLIKTIYDNLQLDKSTNLMIVKDQVNRIKVFHKTSNTKILIRTYLVLIIPVFVDLRSIKELYGTVYYNLDNTIEQLQKCIIELESLNRRKVTKGTKQNEQPTFEQLVRSLSTSDGEHRTS